MAVVNNVGPLLRRNDHRDALFGAIGTLAPGNAICFVEATPSGTKAVPQKRLADAITAAGGIVREFRSPKGGGLTAFIEAEARERQVALGVGAAKELATRIGGFVQEGDAERRQQTRIAATELEKLALYKGDRYVEVDDVRALVAEAIPSSVWALTDAVGERRVARASEMLDRLLDSTPEPVILNVLHRRIRELLEVADRMAAGEALPAIGRAMKIASEFRMRNLAAQARAWSVDELRAALDGLLELDAMVKGAPRSDRRPRPAPPRVPPVGGRPGRPPRVALMQLAPSLHRLGNGLVNSYLLEESGQITIIDAGVSGYWKDLPTELAAMGRTVEDVRAIVLTHGHSDHIGFAERMRRERGTPVRVHELDAALARGEVPNPSKGLGPTKIRPLLEFLLYTGLRGGLRNHPIKEVATFGDGATLDLPGSPRVILVPGHTPGSAALHVPSHDALFVGDAFATKAVTTGEEGPRVAPFTADADEAVRSLARIEGLEARWVLPGHGQAWTAGRGGDQARFARTSGESAASVTSARRRQRDEPRMCRLVAGGPGLFLDDEVALDRENAAGLAEVEQLDQLGIDVQLAAVFAQPSGNSEAQPFAPIRKPERGVEARRDEAAAADGTAVAVTGHVTVVSFGRDSRR